MIHLLEMLEEALKVPLFAEMFATVMIVVVYYDTVIVILGD